MPNLEKAVLRISLTGDWSVAEFGELLLRIDFAYKRLSCYIPPSESFGRRVAAFLNEQLFEHAPQSETRAQFWEEYFEPLISASADNAGNLNVRAVEVHSPGYFEVIGSAMIVGIIWRTISPIIKTGLEAYKFYSDEQLEREKIQSLERIEYAKIESNERISKEKSNTDVWMKMLEDRDSQLPEVTELSERFEAYRSLTRDRPLRMLRELARDRRIIEAEITEYLDDDGET